MTGKRIKKEFVGTVCGHHDAIEEAKDAYCVEFMDVCGDVCQECFEGYTGIKNTESPYDGNLTDYWYMGTLKDYKSYVDDTDSITIKWDVGDVLERAKELNTQISKREARNILATMKHNHDANMGINCEVIDINIELFDNARVEDAIEADYKQGLSCADMQKIKESIF